MYGNNEYGGVEYGGAKITSLTVRIVNKTVNAVYLLTKQILSILVIKKKPVTLLTKNDKIEL